MVYMSPATFWGSQTASHWHYQVHCSAWALRSYSHCLCLHLRIAHACGTIPRLLSGIVLRSRPFSVKVRIHTDLARLRSEPRRIQRLLKMNNKLPNWLLLQRKTYACKAGTKLTFWKCMLTLLFLQDLYLLNSSIGFVLPWSKIQNLLGRSSHLQYVWTISISIGYLFHVAASRQKKNIKIGEFFSR